MRLEPDGFAWLRDALPAGEIAALRERAEACFDGARTRSRGVRNLLEREPRFAERAWGAWREWGEAVAGCPLRPVRAILFDKSPGANWKVPWHQDRFIAVRRRLEVDGYGAWTVKDGVPHVQPELTLLESMVTMRLHLDPASSRNGALQVLPGSHRDGFLEAEAIALRVREAVHPLLCEAGEGDAFFMRPLLLHHSAPAEPGAGQRRLVHVEFAPPDGLAAGLEWAIPAPDGTG